MKKILILLVLILSAFTILIYSISNTHHYNTPLYNAIKNEDTDIAKILIENGADITVQAYGESILSLLIEKKNIELLKLCLENGLDINYKEIDMTLLFYAVRWEDLDFIKYLIQNGADVNIADEDGFKVLDIIPFLEHGNMIEDTLLNSGANSGITDNNINLYLGAAICMEKDSLIEKLLKNGANINKAVIKEIEDQESLLQYAIEYKETHIVEALVKYGANINETYKGGYTPLHLAICSSNCDEKLVMQLIEYGAKIDTATNNKISPLHLAVKVGRFDIIKILIENGADINAKNSYDETPLHIAVVEGDVEIVKYLVNSGVKKDIKNSLGFFPIDIANIEYKKEIQKILKGEETITKSELSIYPFSFTEIDYIQSCVSYDTFVDKFIVMATDIKKNGFVSLSRKYPDIESEFIYKIFEAYYDLKFLGEDQNQLINSLDILLENSRLKDMIIEFIYIIAKEESIGHAKMFCGAMLVDFDDKNPLEWFKDKKTYIDETRLVCDELLIDMKKNGVMSIEPKVYDLSNNILKEFLKLIIDNSKLKLIKKIFALKKTHAIWYIKDNYEDYTQKIQEFESDWEIFEKTFNVYVPYMPADDKMDNILEDIGGFLEE
jgi:ankyrin repeat protein